MTPVDQVAVLGVDPGRKWTAGVLRVGEAAVDGWTVGPVTPKGVLDASAIDNIDDIESWGRYMRRILDLIEATVDSHRAAGGGPVHLAVEMVVPPGGRRIALADWLIPRQVVAGLITYDPNVVLVHPDGHGKHRPVAEHYPPQLQPFRPGTPAGRPPTWGPCEARRGERDHERAAYDVAGVAAPEVVRRAAERAEQARAGS